MIADTLFAKYIEEREQKKILEIPEGFIIYKFVGKECFLAEMYIEKSARRAGFARQLVDGLTKIARENKCDVITANIFLADKNANTTLPAAIGCGFKVVQANQNVLLISKEVTEA